MDYNSNYEGAQVEELLDKVASPDMEMSDESDNLVPNKIIKEYVDLHPRYKDVEDVVAPKSNITPKLARMRFIDGQIYVDCSESFGESKTVQLARLGRANSRHTPDDGSPRYRITKHGWRIYDWESAQQGKRDQRLVSVRLVYKDRLHGYYRYYVMIDTYDDDTLAATPRVILGCFGITNLRSAILRHGHNKVTIPDDDLKTYYASQTYALVIDGAYLPFRLTAQWNRDSSTVDYGGTPLSL